MRPAPVRETGSSTSSRPVRAGAPRRAVRAERRGRVRGGQVHRTARGARACRSRRKPDAHARPRSSPRQRPTRKRSPWIRRGIAIAVVLLLIPVGSSYVDYAATARAPTRSRHPHRRVDPRPRRQRHRQHRSSAGGTRTTRRRPAASPSEIKMQGTVGDTTHRHPVPTPASTTHDPQIQHLPPPTAPRAHPRRRACEHNEGVWQPTGRLVGGSPPSTPRTCAPTRSHTSYYIGLMWLDTKLLRGQLRRRASNDPVAARTRGARRSPQSQRDHVDRRVQLGLQDGLRQRRRLPRRPGDRAARGRRRRRFVIKKDGSRRTSACGAATS